MQNASKKNSTVAFGILLVGHRFAVMASWQVGG
jgi:hypothetical protein